MTQVSAMFFALGTVRQVSGTLRLSCAITFLTLYTSEGAWALPCDINSTIILSFA